MKVPFLSKLPLKQAIKKNRRIDLPMKRKTNNIKKKRRMRN